MWHTGATRHIVTLATVSERISLVWFSWAPGGRGRGGKRSRGEAVKAPFWTFPLICNFSASSSIPERIYMLDSPGYIVSKFFACLFCCASHALTRQEQWEAQHTACTTLHTVLPSNEIYSASWRPSQLTPRRKGQIPWVINWSIVWTQTPLSIWWFGLQIIRGRITSHTI